MQDVGFEHILLNGCCLHSTVTSPASIDCIITDPPYGEDMGFDGDATIQTAADLLRSASQQWYDLLKPNSFIAVFWASRSVDVALDILRESNFRFRRILNMYIPRGGARPYRAWLPRTQPILLMQKYLPKESSTVHKEVCCVLKQRMEYFGYSRQQLAALLNCNSRLVMKWTREDDPAWCLPTPRFYSRLKTILEIPDSFDYLLTREPTKGPSRSYDYKHDTYVVSENKSEIIEHPCQKPLSVLTHLVESLTDKGGIVFDPFMGSGSTGVACLNTGRKFIGIEKDTQFFNIAKNRIEAISSESRLHT